MSSCRAVVGKSDRSVSKEGSGLLEGCGGDLRVYWALVALLRCSEDF